MSKYGNVAWIFRIIGVMAKTLYEYWNGHLCSVGIAGPNIARVSIVEAEKCTRIDITCGVTINDDLPCPYFLTCSANDVE